MKDRRTLYQEFQKAFPIEYLKGMTLVQYTNLSKKDSFCYWVESKTEDLGSIWGGTSYKFGIYEYDKRPKADDPKIQTDNKYAWYRRYGKETANDAFEVVKSAVIRVAEYAGKGNLDNIEKENVIGEVYKWKIAFLYSHETLIPIYNKKLLQRLAGYYGMNEAGGASVPELQRYLINKKGDEDLYLFYCKSLDILANYEDSPTNNYWVFSPGEKASKWESCKKENTICINWDELGDLSQYVTSEDVTLQIQKVYGKPNSSHKNDCRAIWDFTKVMKPGDIVYVKLGVNKIIGRGIIESDYYFDERASDYKSKRKVKWSDIGEWDSPISLPVKTLTKLSGNDKDLRKLEDLFKIQHDGVDAKQYWWLVASPKIWSLSKMPIGQVVSYTLYNDNGHQRRIFQNFLDAREGDVIIGYEANPIKQIVAIAEVYKASDSTEIYFQKKETLTNPIDYSMIKDIPELSGMEFMKNKNGSFFKLTKFEYDALIDLIREVNPLVLNKSNNRYTKEDFLKDVFMDSENYDKLKSLLLGKKNIILQGAPGVGKTFSAKRLAYSVIGETDKSKIEFIQFHQNYSYEDFVMGYKPKEDGGFELRRGVFYTFCKRAQSDPENKYFFIIDEINRGNLSKIFGELLMLIEKDYRGDENEIRLAYNDELFSVPENLYIIGMMNTADRSLAMIDYALRRRFSFFNMAPGFDSKGFKEYQSKLDNAFFDRVIEAVKLLNKVISGDDSLGEGFCIGHSYFCGQNVIDNEWLKNVINYEIIPMLREYWFDNNRAYQNEVEELTKLIQ